MLLLVTIGLVLIGTVSLVIGFVRNSLGPIYVSILCSVVAGVVLVLFSRMSRRQAATAAAGAGEPAVELPEAPALSVVGAAEPEVAEEEEATGAAEAARPGPETPLAGEPAFPITAYDELRVNEVVPLLAELDLDELDLVREHEERGKNRATLIKRIDDRIDELESAAAVAPPSPPVPAAVPRSPEGAAALPIAEYDELSVTEILPLLDELDDDELETVAEYEERTKNRQTIIKRIDAIFEEPMPEQSAPRTESPIRRLNRPEMTSMDRPESIVRTMPSVRPLPMASIHRAEPKRFNDIRDIGERFKQGIPVIMSLQSADEHVARRLVDFASGLVFGLDGSIEVVASRVYLLTPANMEVSAEERERLVEGGFFNQL